MVSVYIDGSDLMTSSHFFEKCADQNVFNRVWIVFLNPAIWERNQISLWKRQIEYVIPVL